ncbi:MAG: hypothetical protein IH948_03140 [Bacteroidetes bacterium]|nr:hypothetical protein [Bacteroidota bacterium]
MKNINQIGALVMATMVAFVTIGIAQDQKQTKVERPVNKDRQVKQKVMRDELEKYRTEKIAPGMRAYRDKLDKLFSAEDLQKVVALRRQMTAMKTNAKKKRETMTSTAEKKEKQARVMREAQQRQRTGIERNIGEIANKYSTEIDNLQKELNKSREQWKLETKAIRDKHGVQDGARTREHVQRNPKSADHGRNHAKREEGRGEHAKKDNLTEKEKANMKRIRFILMDPDEKRMRP